ncbi:MAG: DNA-binding protein [Rhodobacter sp. CACIA14H1]|nr:MAG: DNA-binding protein [Rhodobacter sp. CACIA14H1]
MAASTARKSSTPKSSTAKAKPAKAVVAAPAAVTDGAEAPETEAKTATVQLKKKELVARVVTALDGKKKGNVKDIVEATLATLGAAIQSGESLNLPPFGKVRVTRQKGSGTDAMATLRIRGAGSKNAPKAPKEALAEAGEDD